MPSAIRLRTDFTARRASAVGQEGQGRQPEPAIAVAGGGSQWHEPYRGCHDRRHGPADPA